MITLSELCIKSLLKNYKDIRSLIGLPGSLSKIIREKARERGISTSTEFLKIFLEFIDEKLVLSLNDYEFQKFLSKNLTFSLEISSLDLTGVKSINDGSMLTILKFRNLQSLNLSFTLVSDLGLSHLLRPLPNSGLCQLKFLNISGTKITRCKLFKLIDFPNISIINVSYLLSKKESIQIFSKDLGWELCKDKIQDQQELYFSRDFKAWILDLPLKEFKESDHTFKLDPYLAFRPRLTFKRL